MATHKEQKATDTRILELENALKERDHELFRTKEMLKACQIEFEDTVTKKMLALEHAQDRLDELERKLVAASNLKKDVEVALEKKLSKDQKNVLHRAVKAMTKIRGNFTGAVLAELDDSAIELEEMTRG